MRVVHILIGSLHVNPWFECCRHVDDLTLSDSDGKHIVLALSHFERSNRGILSLIQCIEHHTLGDEILVVVNHKFQHVDVAVLGECVARQHLCHHRIYSTTLCGSCSHLVDGTAFFVSPCTLLNIQLTGGRYIQNLDVGTSCKSKRTVTIAYTFFQVNGDAAHGMVEFQVTLVKLTRTVLHVGVLQTELQTTIICCIVCTACIIV